VSDQANNTNDDLRRSLVQVLDHYHVGASLNLPEYIVADYLLGQIDAFQTLIPRVTHFIDSGQAVAQLGRTVGYLRSAKESMDVRVIELEKRVRELRHINDDIGSMNERLYTRLRFAREIIETADNRAAAVDGPVGHVRDMMSDREWFDLYHTIKEGTVAYRPETDEEKPNKERNPIMPEEG